MLIENQPIKGDCPLFNIDVVSPHQLFILLLMSKKMYEKESVKNVKRSMLIQKLIFERSFFGPTLISSINIIGQSCVHLAMNIDF
jgi:hypothetical protein